MAYQKLVTLYGGSGFVGRYIVRCLAERGYRIRVAVRRPDLAGHLQPLGGVGQISLVQANLRYENSVRRTCAGSDIVINLVGLLHKSGKQTFEAVHVEGARYIAKAAADQGACHLIHISSIGAEPQAAAQYARTKAAGEAAVLEEFPTATIFRPSVIFGPEDNFFNLFARLASISPVLPLIGGGRTRFQPIYVGDIADAVMKAVDGGAHPGRIYELGGPEIVSMKDVMEKILALSGRRALLMSIPFSLAKLDAFFLQMLPTPPLTVDQVRLLESDNVVSQEAIKEGRTLKDLGLDHPRAIDAIIPIYLQRFHPKGQYSVI